jgi:hypothetical protein
MKKHFTQFLNRPKNSRGQVALFIALIFQILFIFFAMVINVGLLVHHKINLQNSVDLAAYYGAMKQSEGMNAIGHINYQIRQGWKLLTFRYRMIGSAGDFETHPYNKDSKGPNGSIEDEIGSTNVGFYDAPSFCATYVPFKPMPKDENTCRQMSTMSGVKLFQPPAIIAGFLGFTSSVRAATEAMRDMAIQQCKIFGTYNYLLLGSFVVAFKKDQRDRSAAIATLANGLSYAEDDFYDLDGDLASKGIRTTLRNNLTTANNDSMKDGDIKIYNSLGSESCNGSGVAKDNPPKWLSPIKIYPAFNYIDTRCSKEMIQPVGKQLPSTAGDESLYPEHYKEQPPSVVRQVQELGQFIGLINPISNLYNFSVGVEKNPWCMAYVGVSATASPNIPFSPFGAIKLVARSFAKPFGGKIGPWYKAGWAPGSNISNTGKKIDNNLPPRVMDLSAVTKDAMDPTRAANYSRFVGDPFGLKTRNVLYQFGKAIYELDPRWASSTAADLNSQASVNYTDGAPNFKHWDHLPFDYGKKGGDLLAWDWDKQQPSRMRYLELAAIQPDLFDLAYYSIEPDYYHNYYLRIRDKYMKGPGSSFNGDNKSFLPDYGYHQGYKAGSENLEEFSVKNQFVDAKKAFASSEVIENRLTYMVKQWDHALTGWADISLSDYSLSTSKLGKCQYPKVGEDDLEVPTSGNCAVGGTSGFSVKTVSHDYLMKQDLNLGGDSAGSGPLLNPPPEDF